MAKIIRYALATFCFAVSVGCLALWIGGNEYTAGVCPFSWCARLDGSGGLGCISIEPSPFDEKQLLYISVENTSRKMWFEDYMIAKGRFGAVDTATVFFPLWYPALVFALAGVGVIRFRRQFSIRSALIVFAVVAALLAMPLAL
ncbi:hypothetical protein [Lacipirellula limnantheis]|uniref:Uncharacterized protein n=1 Tax=Lacipirellula limnantheis TaxID=2528024 RepID=A0A517U082_9BACT|nr:hypothetical protein [Lacipirellula limnantheis]QDT74030.1 hypothetical protein I41_32240 [Lacipirellula limnantheis]